MDEALTDDEWRAFQAIPDQGYSHRAWIDARIAERTDAVLDGVSRALDGVQRETIRTIGREAGSRMAGLEQAQFVVQAIRDEAR